MHHHDYNFIKKPIIADKEPEIDRPKKMEFCDDLSECPTDIEGVCIGKNTINFPHLQDLKKVYYICLDSLDEDVHTAVKTCRTAKILHFSRMRQELTNLGFNVPYCSFFSCSKLTSLDFITSELSVKGIRVSSCMKFSTLAGIDRFKNLEELAFDGSLSGSIKMDSLEPLASAKSLKYLAIACKLKSTSLSPIHELSGLRYLNLAGAKLKDEDYQGILESCPKLPSILMPSGEYTRKAGFVKKA